MCVEVLSKHIEGSVLSFSCGKGCGYWTDCALLLSVSRRCRWRKKKEKKKLSLLTGLVALTCGRRIFVKCLKNIIRHCIFPGYVIRSLTQWLHVQGVSKFLFEFIRSYCIATIWNQPNEDKKKKKPSCLSNFNSVKVIFFYRYATVKETWEYVQKGVLKKPVRVWKQLCYFLRLHLIWQRWFVVMLVIAIPFPLQWLLFLLTQVKPLSTSLWLLGIPYFWEIMVCTCFHTSHYYKGLLVWPCRGEAASRLRWWGTPEKLLWRKRSI